MEADIDTLLRKGIEVDDENYLTSDNYMQSDDVLPTPSSLTLVFHVVYPWRQSGNFPVVSSNLKMTPIPRIHHMS